MASLGDVGSPPLQEKLRPHLRDPLHLREHLAPPRDSHRIRPDLSPNSPQGLPRSDRISVADIRPGDLVSRLLAATPPYLYSVPHPTSFFFSEMLRSLVAAKTGAGDSTPSAPPTRRPRKRTWRDAALPTGPPIADKPLELTMSRAPPQEDKQGASSAARTSPVLPPPPPPMVLPPCGMLPLPSPDSALPHPDLVLPPGQPPLWYPTLYPLPQNQPPYPIDPLHFFIDLRVSGHIFDRKSKEGTSGGALISEDPSSLPPLDIGLGNPSSLVKQTKHCSAFSVPQPRSKLGIPSRLSESDSDRARSASPPGSATGPNYVLQNLSRIYDEVRPVSLQSPERRPGSAKRAHVVRPKPDEPNNNNDDDNETKPIVDIEENKENDLEKPDEENNEKESEAKKKKRKKDLRALIGLELVVDYVNQDGVPKKRSRTSDEEDNDEDDEDGVETSKGDGSESDCSREDVEASIENKAPSLTSRTSASRSPPLSPQAPAPAPSPPLFHPLNHPVHSFLQGRHPYHHFGPSHFLREATDALNLQVRPQ